MLLSGLIFSFFSYGTRAFAQANAKHGLQADALRTMESLQKELKRSTLASISLKNDNSRVITVDGKSVHRDVITLAALQNITEVKHV